MQEKMRIEFENVSFEYRSPVAPSRPALTGITFTIPPGEMTAIVGSSGSGKTTLIQHMNGLLEPVSGRLRIGDYDSADSRRDVSALRRHVGLVFQFPENQLFEETVNRDIAFGPANQKWSGDRIDQSVGTAMERVGLNRDIYGKRHPFQLSGGEKRRVAIAGVLALDPQVLVLDEPTAGLDWQGVCKVESIMHSCQALGRSVIFVSHDMDLVARLAARVLVLNHGRLVFDGTRNELFAREDLLAESGLALPHIVQAINRIRSRGIDLHCEKYTLEEAHDELKRHFRRS